MTDTFTRTITVARLIASAIIYMLAAFVRWLPLIAALAFDAYALYSADPSKRQSTAAFALFVLGGGMAMQGIWTLMLSVMLYLRRGL